MGASPSLESTQAEMGKQLEAAGSTQATMRKHIEALQRELVAVKDSVDEPGASEVQTISDLAATPAALDALDRRTHVNTPRTRTLLHCTFLL